MMMMMRRRRRMRYIIFNDLRKNSRIPTGDRNYIPSVTSIPLHGYPIKFTKIAKLT
jgi:hypothetical protein